MYSCKQILWSNDKTREVSVACGFTRYSSAYLGVIQRGTFPPLRPVAENNTPSKINKPDNHCIMYIIFFNLLSSTVYIGIPYVRESDVFGLLYTIVNTPATNV